MGISKAMLIGVILFGVTTFCRASQPPIETVQKAKLATAFIEVEEAAGISEGTAFCIDADGLFVTNAHVVMDQKPGGRIVLVLRAGETDQIKMAANVVKLDLNKDLAILEAAHPPKNLVSLPLGSSANLVETMSVVAFGYPFGKDLALKDGDFASISVSTGHITALRKLNGELEAIQLDASLNEGNSGGPIIDTKGDVIAIVMEGIPGSGINLAIPVSHLHAFISSLGLAFVPPVPKAGKLRVSQPFKVELLPQAAGKERAAVEITLKSADSPKRTVTAETSDGKTYTADIALLPGSSGSIPDFVAYEISVTRGGKVVASDEGKISLEEIKAAAAVGTGIAQRRSGKEMIVSCLDSNDVRRFDAVTGEYLGTFAAGNGLQGPQDLLWGPDGSLYICTAYTNSVRRFDGRTGQFLGVLVKDGAGGLSDAMSMAFSPDGDLYVTSLWNNCVKCYSGRSGEFLGDLVPAGKGGLGHPSCLRIGRDGRLYVSSGDGKAVKRYNARTGAYIDDFAVGNDLSPGAFDWGPDGNLYVCSGNNTVKRFDGKTGQYIDDFIKRSPNIDTPLCLTFGSNGILYFGDKTSTIKRYSARTGEFIDVFAGGHGMVYPERIIFR